jgi:hypothetical protein
MECRRLLPIGHFAREDPNSVGSRQLFFGAHYGPDEPRVQLTGNISYLTGVFRRPEFPPICPSNALIRLMP